MSVRNLGAQVNTQMLVIHVKLSENQSHYINLTSGQLQSQEKQVFCHCDRKFKGDKVY